MSIFDDKDLPDMNERLRQPIANRRAARPNNYKEPDMRLASLIAWLIVLAVCLAVMGAVIALQVRLYDATHSPSSLWLMATLLFLAACTMYLSWRDARNTIRHTQEQRWEAEMKRRAGPVPLNQRRA